MEPPPWHPKVNRANYGANQMMTLTDNGRKLLSPWAENDRKLIQGDERGSGRIMLSESDKLYIHQQIARYNHYSNKGKATPIVQISRNSEAIRRDSLWRIASCANLFEDLDPTGKLTDDQWNQVIDFIEQFQGGQD